jgi:molecular chaperone HtpG
MNPDTCVSSLGTQPTIVTDEKFLVDLGGVLSILSESIYTAGPEVFIRELMQNGQDAITARRLIEPGFAGVMSLEVVTSDDGAVTVVVEDNGIGLTLEESRRALATIAFSTKKNEDESADTSPFVGRFGIGILSGFLVADEITIFSRRAGSDAVPVHWVGNIGGTFTTLPSTSMKEPGSSVILRLRADAAKDFGASDVFEVAQKYGRYLPHPVTFRSGDKTQLVTDEDPLWESSADSHEVLQRGGEIFEVPMLSAFPFESRDAGAKGIAFIQAESCHATAEATHVVFIKNMLVSERALDLEPPKAPFLRLFFNSDRLRPNAGRDAVMANDPRLPALRRDVEAALKKHLARLHRENPDVCAEIVASQYRCLAELAEKDRAYLGLLVDWLPLETTLGRLTLGEILKRHTSKLEYVTDTTEFQRVQAKARAEGDCVARVETERSHRLMELVSAATEGKVSRVTANEYLARFNKKAGDPSQREKLVLDIVEKELQPENCSGAFYDTDEPDEISRLDMGTEESLDRLLSVEFGGEAASKKLLLNRRHSIISQMIDGAADAALLRVWIRVLYQLALLEAREVPTAAETRRFSRALGNAFTASSLGSL